MIPETLHVQVSVRALRDPAFRQALLSNPRAVLARDYHLHLPDQVAVQVLVSAPNTLTIVLQEASVDLDDADLQTISGGAGKGGIGGEF